MSAARSRSKPTSKVVYDWDRISRARADGLDDLLVAHWKEVETDLDRVPLDIDWPRYYAAERIGTWRAISARRDGRLIGYNGLSIQKPMHHASREWAIGDVLYLDPAERRGMIGARLITVAAEKLRALKIEKVVYHARPGSPLAKLLTKLGYRHREEVFDCFL